MLKIVSQRVVNRRLLVRATEMCIRTSANAQTLSHRAATAAVHQLPAVLRQMPVAMATPAEMAMPVVTAMPVLQPAVHRRMPVAMPVIPAAVLRLLPVILAAVHRPLPVTQAAVLQLRPVAVVAIPVEKLAALRLIAAKLQS